MLLLMDLYIDEEWDHVHSNVTICPGSGSNKSAHLEGEQWELTPCLKCTCHRGLTLCATQTCPPAPCQTSDLETPAIGSCCPKCKPGLVNKEPESNIMQARVSEMRSVPLRGTLKVDVGGRRTTAVMSTLRKNCFSDDLQLKYADGEAWKVMGFALIHLRAINHKVLLWLVFLRMMTIFGGAHI